jgi:hypothetical protein
MQIKSDMLLKILSHAIVLIPASNNTKVNIKTLTGDAPGTYDTPP